MRTCLAVITAVVMLVQTSGCARYETRVVPFKMPEGYRNVQTVDSAKIAAVAYDKTSAAKEAFGFNIRDAGLLPVQVVFDNQGGKSLLIDPAHTYLVDREHNLWPEIEGRMAYERIEKATEIGKVAEGAGKPAFLGAAAGAIIGAAIGIVSGENVGSAAGKGAALGAAAGATIGGSEAYGSTETRHRIVDDLEKKQLQNKPVPPGQIAHGFIFFPGECKSAKELRLQLQEVETRKVLNLILPF